MTLDAGLEESATTPIPHPLDSDADGVNRPGLHKNARYHEIRETGTGVAEVRRHDGTTARLVTRYHDVEQVLRKQDVFSREAALDADAVDLEGTMLGLDLEDHAAVRGAVKDWFSPQATERLRHRRRCAPPGSWRRCWTGRSPPTSSPPSRCRSRWT